MSSSNTQGMDIETKFPNGVNARTFKRAYITELISTAGMTRAEAQEYSAETHIRTTPGRVASGRLIFEHSSGTLEVGVGNGTISDMQQQSIDNASSQMTGQVDEGEPLSNLPAGRTSGEQFYCEDAPRTSSAPVNFAMAPEAPETGAMLYWNKGKWRYVRDDSIAVTPV